MRTLTNGDDVLDPFDVDRDTWTFRPLAHELPISGRSSWWGAFRRGDHVRVELSPGETTTEVRILGRAFSPMTGAIVGREGGTLDFEVPRDGVYHLRFDGSARTRVEFALEVRIPNPNRRQLRAVHDWRTQGGAVG